MDGEGGRMVGITYMIPCMFIFLCEDSVFVDDYRDNVDYSNDIC